MIYPDVNRVELITEEGGRVFVRYDEDMRVNVMLQDNEKTLKVFVGKKVKES